MPGFCIHNRHQSFYTADRSLESMCSGSAEPSIRLPHILAGHLLKFCDHAICCNTPTLNNLQNLNLDFFGSEFLSSMNSGTWECRQMPNFRGNKDLCKLGKEYLNDLLCKFGLFVYNILKLLTYHTPFYGLPSLSYQRSNRSGIFGPPCSLLRKVGCTDARTHGQTLR